VEPAERQVMRRAPYAPNESIFSRGLGWSIIWVGLLLGIAPLALGYYYWINGNPAWQTVAFTALVLSQMSLALAVRSERESLFQQGLWSNRAMVGAVALTLLLQLGVIYIPFARGFFETELLSAQELGVALLVCTLPFWGVELEKWLRRRRS
jgi:Ca2+-transporting ATPase